jgi:hypothetical protein
MPEETNLFISSKNNIDLTKFILFNIVINSYLLFFSSQILIVLSFEHEIIFPFEQYVTLFILLICAFIIL